MLKQSQSGKVSKGNRKRLVCKTVLNAMLAAGENRCGISFQVQRVGAVAKKC